MWIKENPTFMNMYCLVTQSGSSSLLTLEKIKESVNCRITITTTDDWVVQFLYNFPFCFVLWWTMWGMFCLPKFQCNGKLVDLKDYGLYVFKRLRQYFKIMNNCSNMFNSPSKHLKKLPRWLKKRFFKHTSACILCIFQLYCVSFNARSNNVYQANIPPHLGSQRMWRGK